MYGTPRAQLRTIAGSYATGKVRRCGMSVVQQSDRRGHFWRRLVEWAVLVLAVSGLSVAFCYSGAAFHYLEKRINQFAMGLPVRSPEHGVRKVVKDDQFGGFAIGPCIEYGDLVLPLLARETSDFSTLDWSSVRRIAEVLSEIRTEECESVLRELWARDCHDQVGDPFPLSVFEDNPVLLAKALGAVALAKQGKLNASPVEVAFLVDCVAGRYSCGQTSRDLCAWALGFGSCTSAVPALVALIPEVNAGRAPSAVLDALALLGVKEAVGPIRGALASSHTKREPSQSPYNTEGAVRALVLLGDRDLVPFLIDQMPPTPVPSEHWTLSTLRTVTDEDFGTDPGDWQNWWTSTKGTWQYSDELLEQMRTLIMPRMRDTWSVIVSGDSEVVY